MRHCIPNTIHSHGNVDWILTDRSLDNRSRRMIHCTMQLIARSVPLYLYSRHQEEQCSHSYHIGEGPSINGPFVFFLLWFSFYISPDFLRSLKKKVVKKKFILEYQNYAHKTVYSKPVVGGRISLRGGATIGLMLILTPLARLLEALLSIIRINALFFQGLPRLQLL